MSIKKKIAKHWLGYVYKTFENEQAQSLRLINRLHRFKMQQEKLTAEIHKQSLNTKPRRSVQEKDELLHSIRLMELHTDAPKIRTHQKSVHTDNWLRGFKRNVYSNDNSLAKVHNKTLSAMEQLFRRVDADERKLLKVNKQTFDVLCDISELRNIISKIKKYKTTDLNKLYWDAEEPAKLCKSSKPDKAGPKAWSSYIFKHVSDVVPDVVEYIGDKSNI